MANILLHLCLSAFVFLFSCTNSVKQASVIPASLGEPDSVFIPKYASGFKISYFGMDKLIEVVNPWDSTLAGDRFLVSNSDVNYQEDIPVIKAPVANWSAFSSSQVVLAEIIGVLETLKSVAEPEYISSGYVQNGLKSGSVRNVGMASSADLEVILLSQPQFIFVSPFKDNQYEQLREAGLVVIPDAGYLENTPLGRTEWIVFFGAFFNLENKAIEYFKKEEQSYHKVRQQLVGIQNKPTLTTGYLFQDVWFLPAGESYIATLFSDAGGLYPYRQTAGTGSLALDFEKVFHDTHQCEFWVLTVNHPGEFGYNDLKAMDARYADFTAFKEQRVICSNTFSSRFFERGWVEPHIVLKDLAKAFHPGLFSNHQPVYFKIIKEEQ